uniref:SURF1-like protein n=1 Tax=Panagrellus redivivus TaxID=6233 RepID=A0A7E4ZW29_PANRE
MFQVVKCCQASSRRSISTRLYSLSREPGFGNEDKYGPSVLKLNDRSGKNSYSGRTAKPKGRFKYNSLLLLSVPAAAFGLGVWQVQRLYWKLKLIDDLESTLDCTAVPFPIDDLSQLENLEYRRVHLRGRFLYDREFVIAPRGRFDKDHKEKRGGLAGDSESSSHGGHVITPFVVEGTDLIIMVNRGWLPTSKLRAIPHPNPGKVVEFDAIVRKSENRPQFVSENNVDRGIWFYKNFEQMGDYCGAAPIYVEATHESTTPEGPIAGQTNVTVRNEHLNYLITWFSLSAITTGMWYLKFVR